MQFFTKAIFVLSIAAVLMQSVGNRMPQRGSEVGMSADEEATLIHKKALASIKARKLAQCPCKTSAVR